MLGGLGVVRVRVERRNGGEAGTIGVRRGVKGGMVTSQPKIEVKVGLGDNQ